MSIFLIEAVRRDADGEVTDVMWGKVDPDNNRWLKEPHHAPVDDVVSALDSGDQVFSRHRVQGQFAPPRRTVIRRVLANGNETIQSGPAQANRPGELGLEDLPEF